MKRIVATAMLSMVAWCAHAQTGEGVRNWESFDKRVQASQRISAHGPDLLGDQVSLSNGGVSFTVTDVSVPGNNALPVAFARTFTVSNRKDYLNDGALADWQLDVPHISGVFASEWVGSVPGNPGKRCSVTSQAQARPPVPSVGEYLVEDIWNGNTLHIPGKEGGELLLIHTQTPRPTTGGPYYWHVPGHTVVSCLPSTNNQTDREGFLATTADGTRYWFNHMAQYREPSLRYPVVSDTFPGGYGTVTAQRRRNVLYATRVEDRFGNRVDYTYANAANQPAKLTSIASSDGRRLEITYSGPRIVKVTAKATDAPDRHWQYVYGAAPDSQQTLTTVILPDDAPGKPSRWTLELGELSRAKIWYANQSAGEPTRNCFLNWGHWQIVPPQFTGRVTHPTGATGEFTFDIQTHGRSWVPISCSLGSPPRNPGEPRNTNDDVNRWVISYESLTLVKKALSGPGLALVEWLYEYQPNTAPAPFLPGQSAMNPVCPFGVDCSVPVCTDDSCARSAITTVRAPGGKWERYFHGNTYRYNEGKLLKVERGGYDGNGSEVVQHRVINTYDLSQQNVAYRASYGYSALELGNAFPTEFHRPLLQTATQQQSTTFTRKVNTFDAFARGLSVTKSSTLPGAPSRTEVTAYHDNTSKWILGQVASVKCTAPAFCINGSWPDGMELSRTTYSSSHALPLQTYAFDKLQQTLTYNADGTLASISDGRDGTSVDTTILLSGWKRGIPQVVQYPGTTDQPSGTSQSAVVDDNGWITSVTSETGATTAYEYDAMGRMARVDYPTEAPETGVVWNATTSSFSATGAAVYGLPANHWVHVVTTGNGKKVTRFDALWRPLIEEAYSAAEAGETRTLVVKRYDAAGRLAFQSHPLRTLSNWTTVSAGTTTQYDALDRVTEVRIPSVDAPGGFFRTKTEYLSEFRQKVTNPNLFATTTRFLAWDQPTTDFPVEVVHPEDAYTKIQRDALGKPVALTRHNTSGTQTLTRRYVYRPDTQELCKTIEPEAGVTVMDHDAAGNLGWSAAGLDLTAHNSCNLGEAWNSGRRVGRSYDARNRLKDLVFPDGNGNQAWSYYPDGKPRQITTWNIGFPGADPKETRNLYTYYNRGQLKTELIAVPAWYTFSVEHGYNANGHATSVSYPSGRTVVSTVNALGQAKAIASPSEGRTYASGISYHPNGAVAQFTYGNNIVHQMAQNDRQLPEWSRSSHGTTDFLYDEVDYDGNGNVLAIADLRSGGNGRTTRTMSYDGLGRLKSVASPMYGSAGAHYTYDTLDNLTRVRTGGTAARDHYYCYDANYRLSNLKTGSCSGTTVIGLGYDAQGNLQNRSGQLYRFDYGNRLREVEGVERYRYDGHGRRVLAMQFATGTVLSQYAMSGQLLYQNSDRTGLQSDMIYLGSSLLAIREQVPPDGAVTVKYQHTDALGSPVMATSQARVPLERTEYEPYGKVLNRPVHDGPGYTGHVEDAATGLVYMQQRYYDPQIGRFLSVDPVTADGNSGGNFNRYWYANNNPYKFTDPDGRFGVLPEGARHAETSSVAPINPYSGPVLPTKSGVVTSGFGERVHPVTGQVKLHNGTDFRAPKGEEIRSTQSGEVASVTSGGGPGGNQIMVQNNDGSLSGYAHTGAAEGVQEGTRVEAGATIGHSDASGRITGAHLHYTYRPGTKDSPATTATKPVDPVKTQLKDREIKQK